MNDKDRAYKIVLLAVLGLLREQGENRAGELDGLNAYQALSEALTQARAYGLSADDIGLGGFNPDTLLNPAEAHA
ncbi:MAG: hypothetical protein ABS45_02420 [Comamonas sp. SCN 65-56]|uniref:hypothetical protein n=1 Tax=Comamonas sp. SCN 65-56 TaxID=1660095 RepID=UPI00086DFD03|nr:hypothetical protein [Comamonas sp. SCN 65-56]ODS93596.1 MAG: hypothetical protein ABS45_02420 [Comamonas sp. SCN 65-56]